MPDETEGAPVGSGVADEKTKVTVIDDGPPQATKEPKPDEKNWQAMGEELRKMREERDTLQAQLAEWQSRPIHEPPPSPPAYGDVSGRLTALEDKLGLERGELTAAISPVLGTMASQAEGLATMHEQLFKTTDPDFDLWVESYRAELNKVPPQYRGDPKVNQMARKQAIADNLDRIVQRRVQTAESGAEVVGRFTERAAPGRQGAPENLSPQMERLANEWGVTPEQKANIARRRAAEGRS